MNKDEQVQVSSVLALYDVEWFVTTFSSNMRSILVSVNFQVGTT